jgi:chemotaxis signal transduction protein
MRRQDLAKDLPYAIVEADHQLFAISAADVREMILMPELCQVPELPPHVRGVINLRGRVLQLLDLRTRIGRVPAAREIEEFCELMNRREQDHVSWLGELERSVNEDRDFRLTLDPHQCAFGKWYDAYRADNMLVAGCLRKFDKPHKRIHALGAEVRACEDRGDRDSALALIDENRRTTLAEMTQLFAGLRTMVREQQREMAIILNARGDTFGAAVDRVESVERIPAASIGPLPPGLDGAYGGVVSGVIRGEGNKGLILLLEAGKLADHLAKDPACEPLPSEPRA